MDIITLIKKGKYTALTEAIENDNELLKIKDANGNNLLMLSIFWRVNKRIIEFLAPYFDVSETDYDGWNCIHKAIIVGGVKYISDKINNLNVNISVKITGDTPLILAAQRNDEKAVELLLEKGADKSLLNNKGRNARSYTTNYVISQSLMLILDKEPPNLREEKEIIDPITFDEIADEEVYAFSIGKNNKAYVLGKKATVQNLIATKFKGSNDKMFFDVVLNQLVSIDRIQYCKREAKVTS